MNLLPAEIQKRLDDWFAKQTQLHPYIASLTYVPQDGDVPEIATHTLELISRVNDEKMVIAIQAKPPYDKLADALLGVL